MAPTQCTCCGEYFDEDSEEIGEYESEVDGCDYDVCEDCCAENRFYVYCGGVNPESLFFHDGYPPDANDHIVEYDGKYYRRDVLEDYNLIEIDGEIHNLNDLYKCEITDEYFTDSDDVYTDADDISTTQPVHFPYDCVSREYWDNNVVECPCGTLALESDADDVA